MNVFNANEEPPFLWHKFVTKTEPVCAVKLNKYCEVRSVDDEGVVTISKGLAGDYLIKSNGQLLILPKATFESSYYEVKELK